MFFVKWMTEKSGFSYNEGCLPVAKDITKLPAVYSDFTKNNVKFVIDEPALKGEEDLFSDLNSDSELALASNGNSRVQAIVENASTKKMSYDDMVKQWNSKWNAALKTENVDVKYDTVVK
jgi:ABC-type glycerol-3-phosphate transport system substrate-binding protein